MTRHIDIHPAAQRTPEPLEASDYWYGLVDEKEAGRFLGLTRRCMQAYRQKGGGPRFIVISSRCIRYRRHDLRCWVDGRVRSSTADPGPNS